MKSKRFVGVTISLAFLCTSLFAQNPDVKILTLEQAVNLANENNISIKNAENELYLLKVRNTYSWNSISPTGSVRGSFADDFESNVKNFSVSGTLSLALSTNLYTSIVGAKLNYEAGKLSYEQSCKQIELSVRKAFYGLLYEKEYLLLQQRSLATSKSQYDQNMQKFNNGQMSELDVMTSRVNYEQKKPSVEAAALQLENDLASFKQLLGIPQEQAIELQGSLDDILSVTEINLPEKLAAAPSVASAQYSLENAENSLLSSRFSAYGPTVSATYSYGKSKSDGAASQMNPTGDDWKTSNSLSLAVSIPLDGYFPWSTSSATVRASKINVESAKRNLENTKTTLEINKENYLRKIELGINQIKSLKQNVELANTTYAMTKAAYDYGKTDFQSLQSSNDNVLTAEVTLKNQAYSLMGTILDLEYLLGIPFGSSIK